MASHFDSKEVDVKHLTNRYRKQVVVFTEEIIVKQLTNHFDNLRNHYGEQVVANSEEIVMIT